MQHIFNILATPLLFWLFMCWTDNEPKRKLGLLFLGVLGVVATMQGFGFVVQITPEGSPDAR